MGKFPRIIKPERDDLKHGYMYWVETRDETENDREVDERLFAEWNRFKGVFLRCNPVGDGHNYIDKPVSLSRVRQVWLIPKPEWGSIYDKLPKEGESDG